MRMSVKRMRMSVAVSNWIPETSILVSGRTRVNVRGESKGGGPFYGNYGFARGALAQSWNFCICVKCQYHYVIKNTGNTVPVYFYCSFSLIFGQPGLLRKTHFSEGDCFLVLGGGLCSWTGSNPVHLHQCNRDFGRIVALREVPCYSPGTVCENVNIITSSEILLMKIKFLFIFQKIKHNPFFWVNIKCAACLRGGAAIVATLQPYWQ